MSSEIHVVLPAIDIVAGVNDVFSLIEDPTYTPIDITLTPGRYYPRGDGAADDIFEVIKDELNAHTGEGATYTNTVSFSRAFFGAYARWEGSGGTLVGFALAFSDSGGTRTFDGTLIGHITGGIDTEASPATGCKGVWVPDDLSEVLNEVPRAIGSQFKSVGGQIYTQDRSGTHWLDLEVVWPWIDHDHAEESAKVTDFRTIHAAWAHWRKGMPCEIHKLVPDGATAFVAGPSSSTLVGTYVLDEAHLENYQVRRFSPGVPEYTSPPTLWREYVA